MTYRLIGLMSIVLLLSLGAFALLVGHYQEQLMGELEKTVSEVGRQTLKTVERFSSVERVAERLDGESPEQTRVVAMVDGRVVPFPPGAPPPQDTSHLEDLEHETHFEWKHDDEGGTRAIVIKSLGDGHSPTMLVHLAEVKARTEPGEGLTLTIPAMRAMCEEQTDDIVCSSTIVTGNELIETEGPVSTALVREFRLPIPTTDYTELFSDMRRRSVYLALGVFLVGGLLSAGLATRFTRPIRQLDSGIRELSEGNLDVQVDVQGRDEIGRLGRTFNEMTRRLRANRERTRELTRREKQTALGRLAAGVAHDVRNPLHSVGLTLQHLQETCRPEADERAAEFDRSLDIIRREIGRLDQLVGNFLGFARTEQTHREAVDLPALVQETLRLVEKEAARRKVTLEFAAAGPIPPIQAHPDSLRASLLNLVLNSFDAMPEGGRVAIELGASDREVTLEVADSGEGIPREDHDKIFEFAWTTRDGGHGLGLAMVHEVIVEEHQGRVSLESTPGQGTRFKLALPLEPPHGTRAC